MTSGSEGFETDGPTINSQSSRDFDSGDEVVNLAYEPTVIRGKGGERLWHVEATKQCSTICRLQLTVITF